ncbi:uncharacterized protein LOC106011684 [Aplysia californica]|uniref:Uncharacterized protein LOC106011684 n=1 Tax=Aplysia californica TaxID=6500 RepID=A0ABM0ZZA4_APLCA|nr:uncharacterized protein LOC106011684 [Aplysia californica]
MSQVTPAASPVPTTSSGRGSDCFSPHELFLRSLQKARNGHDLLASCPDHNQKTTTLSLPEYTPHAVRTPGAVVRETTVLSTRSEGKGDDISGLTSDLEEDYTLEVKVTFPQ